MSVINPNPFTTRPEIEGTFGVVATTHWIATAVGMATLEKGGNAFDATVATAFALQVVEPHLNGPGGDVPVIVYDTRRGKPEVITAASIRKNITRAKKMISWRRMESIRTSLLFYLLGGSRGKRVLFILSTRSNISTRASRLFFVPERRTPLKSLRK